MQKGGPKKRVRPLQSQRRPGTEKQMTPAPVFDTAAKGSGKLSGKVALITGGDSGIGKAVAILFAKEGADIAIVYLNEHEDAKATAAVITGQYGKKCILVAGDVSGEAFCKRAVAKTVKAYGKIDVLVNNAAIHYESENLAGISTAQLTKTFATNIFSMFWITRAALEFMKKGSSVINTTSVTAYRGSSELIDYAATKGAIVSFTRSLSANLVKKGIRVNAVAPGPVWTPLIAASFRPSKVAAFGSESPMGRAGQPAEIAPAYLFLATADGAFITGQVIHPNGGEIVNG